MIDFDVVFLLLSLCLLATTLYLLSNDDSIPSTTMTVTRGQEQHQQQQGHQGESVVPALKEGMRGIVCSYYMH